MDVELSCNIIKNIKLVEHKHIANYLADKNLELGFTAFEKCATRLYN